MKYNPLAQFSVLLSILLIVPSFNAAHAQTCVNTAYGKTCKKENIDLEITKRVSKVASIERDKKVTNIGKNEEFIFYIQVRNNSDKDLKNVKVVDNLPSEMIRVSGLDSEETFDLKEGKSRSFEIRAKVRDLEFLNRSNFEKCVVNKAYAFYDDKEKASSSATVCYGLGKATTLPVTGPSEYWLVYGLGVLATGVLIKSLVAFARNKKVVK